MPRVSVIIPARDADATLADALGSLLGQSFVDWEAIVADDDSSDTTAEVADRFGSKVQVVRSPRRLGPGGARNLALARASGDHVAFLDADDAWLPDFLAEHVARMESGPRGRSTPGIVGADARIVTPAGPASYTYFDLVGPRAGPVTLDHLLHHNRLFVSTLVRRRMVQDVGGFDPAAHGAADLDLWIRIAEHGHRIERIHRVLAHYRRFPGTLSSDSAGMASSVCAVLAGVLNRGELTLRQQRIARRSLRHYRRLARLARAAESGPAGVLSQVALRAAVTLRNPRVLRTLPVASRIPGVMRAPQDPQWDGVRDARVPAAGERSSGAPGVLLAVPSLSVGGAERLVITLSHGLVDRGIAVQVAAVPGGLVSELPERADLVALRTGRGPVTIACNVGRLRRAIAAGRADVINSHHLGMALSVAIAARLERRSVRHVLTVHVPERRVSVPIVALATRWFAGVICVSDGVRSELARWLPVDDAHRLITVHPGVSAVPRRMTDSLRVGVVARLVARKGHVHLLRAWLELDVEHRLPSWTLEVWGDGPERAGLHRLIVDAGLTSTVRLRGTIDDAARRMGELSIAVLPSLREGVPLVLLEAQAAGVPVIATDLPGCREALEGGGGLLVEPGDSAALAIALESLMRDEQQRATLGRAGERNWATHFRSDDFVDRYLTALRPLPPARA